MSGFTGIIHLDGAPVDPAVLERMTHLAQKHGGDNFSTRCEASAGFGHCLLRTTPESAAEQQPFSFDRNIWIVGDARVDERGPLVSALQAKDRQARLSQADIELVLHAFYVWGEHCVEHFYGDFAFAVWDQEKRSLFCARDSFGVKPFYYALSGGTFVFSNNLDSVRVYPAMSDELNECAVCDFLVIGYNMDEEATFFKKIARLPPAHTLSIVQPGPPKTRRYQRLVFSQRLHYKNPQDYSQHFLELFKLVVNDRLRTDEVGFELSGGLDSTSVAVVVNLLQRENPGVSTLAVTLDASWSDPGDRETYYAGEVARQYGMKHLIVAAGTKEDFVAPCTTQQPYAGMFALTARRFAALIRSHGRVMLTGQGGDPFLHSSGYPLLDQYRELSLSEFAGALIRSALKKRSIRGLGLRSLLANDTARLPLPTIPHWVNRDFLHQAAVRERWQQLFCRPDRYPPGCLNELAYDEIQMPMWSHLFEEHYHQLFCGIDCRHALFDIRLINFLFSVPASLKQDKWLLRDTMRGLLPEAVRLRPKTGFSIDMTQSLLAEEANFSTLDLSLKNCEAWIDKIAYLEALRQYARGAGGDFFVIMSPIDLDLWINNNEC